MLLLRFLLWTLLALIAGVQARTKTFIVDDAATNLIRYSKGWNVGNLCGGCAAKPDKDKPRDGTWHEGTQGAGRLDELFFTFSFIGTSVEARYIAIDLIGPWTTNTNVSYSIDGRLLNVTQRESTNQTDYLYDQLLFRIDGLSNVGHTLRVDIQQPGVLLLDYLKYTEEIADVQTTTSLGGFSSAFPSPSSPSTSAPDLRNANVGVIIGGVLSGVLVLIISLTSWDYFKRRRRRAQVRLEPTPILIVTQRPVSYPPTKLKSTSRGPTESALVSYPPVPPLPGYFHSPSDRNRIILPAVAEPVIQGLMSTPYSPQSLPPPYSPNAVG